MEAFLLKLLNMSLTGSYVILFVLVVRLCLRRAPRAVSYALWAVPFLRLAVPFSFESAFSLVRVKPEAIPQDIAYAAVPAIDSGVRPLDTVVNAALTAAAPPVDTAASVNPMQVLLFVGFWLWLAGVLVLVGSSLFQTVRLCAYLRTARPVEGNVYEIGRADTPFVFGFLRPRIYLPAGLEDAERAYILAHERHHVARRDHILRALAFAVTAAHWFNPLVWVAYWLMGVDMELSCDEAVLRRAPADIRKAYSSSLVALSTLPRALRPGPLGFSEGGVRSRVKNALRYRRPARWLTVLAVCACLLAACGLLSSPDSGDDPAASSAASGASSSEAPPAEPVPAASALPVGFEQVPAAGRCDFDRDGVEEEYKVTVRLNNEQIYDYTVSIGGQELSGEGVSVEELPYLVSLDGETVQLVLYDDGPSSDPASMVYGWNENGIFYAGALYAHPDQITLQDGVICAIERVDVMQTAFFPLLYRLEGTELVRQQDPARWYSNAGGATKLTTQTELTLFAEDALPSEPGVTIPAGAAVTLTGTALDRPPVENLTPGEDPFYWVRVEVDGTGETGYLLADAYQCYLPGAELKMSPELFDGLSFAD